MSGLGDRISQDGNSKVTEFDHTMEMLGRSAVKVKEGRVLEVGEPVIKYCPLWLHGIARSRLEAAGKHEVSHEASRHVYAAQKAGDGGLRGF